MRFYFLSLTLANDVRKSKDLNLGVKNRDLKDYVPSYHPHQNIHNVFPFMSKFIVLKLFVLM